ncbi:MAG TPA: DMT family transporter [Solirubrobacteraceae bacterium]|nr:DMT family transporter [Solirubrobacteraceae bacterium]
MEIILAVASALLFAFGTVLQQRAGISESSDGGHAGLVLRLARRPVWLAGILADGLGFVAQAAALASGRLAVVQPVLVFSVVFAVPLGVRLSGQRVNRTEIGAAVLVVVALIAFLSVANPSGGRTDAPWHAWVIAGVVAAVVCVPLLVIGRRGHDARRAAMFGTAAGVLFALCAALTKAVVDGLGIGLVHVLTSWEPYALVTVGYASMTVNQLALNTGALAATMATSTSADPIGSVLLGLLLFHESLQLSGLRTVGIAVVLALALLGMTVLARSQAQIAQAAP